MPIGHSLQEMAIAFVVGGAGFGRYGARVSFTSQGNGFTALILFPVRLTVGTSPSPFIEARRIAGKVCFIIHGGDVAKSIHLGTRDRWDSLLH